MSDVAHAIRRETGEATALIESLSSILAGDDEATAVTVEGETNLIETIERGLRRVVELDRMMDAVSRTIADLKDRGERFEKQREAQRQAIAVAMEATGQRKIELPIATLSLRNVPPKADVIDEAAIPSRFWKAQDPKLDKKALLDALKDKQDVPGAVLSNGGVSLNVRLS